MEKNNLTKLLLYLGKTNILLIWAGLVAAIIVIGRITGTQGMLEGNALCVLVIISNPLLIGFTYAFVNGKQQKLALRQGALRGAFAVLFISVVETAVSQIIFSDVPSLGVIWGIFSIFISVILGAIAGIVATLWKNKDQEKTIKQEAQSSGSQNGENKPNQKSEVIELGEKRENEQREKSEVIGSGKSDAMNDMLFYSAYIFIALGAVATLGLVSYPNYWAVFSASALLLLAPSVVPLIVTTLLWKLYNNRVSGIAVQFAALAFLLSSISVTLSIIPKLKQMWGGLYLFSLYSASGWYILTLVVVFYFGLTIKALKKKKK